MCGGGRGETYFYVANGIVLCTCYVFSFCSGGLNKVSSVGAINLRRIQTAFKITLTKES